jgi:integrase
MTINSVSARFEKITACHLGKRMGLHLSRHGLATGLAIEDPDNVRMGASMLSHASFDTTEGSYIAARQIEASRKFRKLVQVPKHRRNRGRC